MCGEAAHSHANLPPVRPSLGAAPVRRAHLPEVQERPVGCAPAVEPRATQRPQSAPPACATARTELTLQIAIDRSAYLTMKSDEQTRTNHTDPRGWR